MVTWINTLDGLRSSKISKFNYKHHAFYLCRFWFRKQGNRLLYSYYILHKVKSQQKLSKYGCLWTSQGPSSVEELWRLLSLYKRPKLLKKEINRYRNNTYSNVTIHVHTTYHKYNSLKLVFGRAFVNRSLKSCRIGMTLNNNRSLYILFNIQIEYCGKILCRIWNETNEVHTVHRVKRN